MTELLAGGSESESLGSVWRSLHPRHLGMAFFWACSMLTFRSSILLSGDASSPTMASIVTVTSFTVNMTVLFLLAAKAEQNPQFYQRIPQRAIVGGILTGLVLLFVSGHLSGAGVYVAIGLGSALAGAGYGYLWGSWAECFGRMHPSRTALYVPLSFLVTAVLFLAISTAAQQSATLALACMLPLPVLSFWCLQRCRQEPSVLPPPQKQTAQRSLNALGALGSLILASAILSSLFGFLWELAVMTVHSVNEAHQVPLFGNLIAAFIMVGFVSFAHRRIDLDTAFRILVPLLAVLFVLLPFFWQERPVLLNAAMSTCYGVFDLIIWYTVASTSYDFAVSGYTTGGIVRAVSILARLIGMGVGYLVALVPGDRFMPVVAVSAAALYALFMLLAFYLSQKRAHRKQAKAEAGALLDSTPGDEAIPTATIDATSAIQPESSERESTAMGAVGPAAREPSATEPPCSSELPAAAQTHTAVENERDAALSAIAEDYGLTRREAEVLPYLARGRSARVIADALFVSESTIRTHTRRILEKTDLHSKQQLIDLIDRYLRTD